MKHGVVLVVASSAILAALVGAHVVAPLPDGALAQGAAKVATASHTPSPTAGAERGASASTTLVEVRQAPVPLPMRERPPAVLAQPVDTVTVAIPPTADLGEGSFAKNAIEADGYKAVKNVVAGPDGTWRARALRGNAEVVLTVDREGRVSAD